MSADHIQLNMGEIELQAKIDAALERAARATQEAGTPPSFKALALVLGIPAMALLLWPLFGR